MTKKQAPYRTTMWAIFRDGQPFMILPDIDEAETHFGLWSKNGFSKHKWEIKPATVVFPPETAAERRTRLNRSVQAVVALNQEIEARRTGT